MPLDTLDRTPPSFFSQGPSALSRLVALVALALLLMVADARFQLMQPLRATIATLLYPAQWLALQPVQWAQNGLGYLTELKTARLTEDAARRKLAEQSQRAGQVEHLLLENTRLRDLLSLGQRLDTPATAAEVLYEATDPYRQRVVINKGLVHGVEAGSPTLDESGVLGQVTRVYPFVSEITLLVDRDQVIPVINTRTGARAVAYGVPSPHGGLIELRYVAAADDMREGDLITTSGIDGVYPPGLPVAQVLRVDRRSDSSFARILCTPLARFSGVQYVMVLKPLSRPTLEQAREAQSAEQLAAAQTAARASPQTTARPAASTPARARPPASAQESRP